MRAEGSPFIFDEEYKKNAPYTKCDFCNERTVSLLKIGFHKTGYKSAEETIFCLAHFTQLSKEMQLMLRFGRPQKEPMEGQYNHEK